MSQLLVPPVQDATAEGAHPRGRAGAWAAGRLRDVLVVAGAALAIEGCRRALTQAVPRPLAGVLGCLAALAVVAALRRLLRRQAPRLCGMTAVRLLVYAVLLGAALSVWWIHPFQDRLVAIPFGAMLGLWAVVSEFGPRLQRPLPRRLLRGCDVLLLTLAALMVLGEVALRGLAELIPSPLFAREDSSAAAHIRQFGLLPGELRYGFRCNSGGHYDEEFAPKRPGELNVVAVGDSFSAGVVPHEFHFTTVCERLLPGCRVQNLGVPGSGPAEYLVLLETQGLPLRPDLIVISLFLGNDLEGKSPSLLQRCLDRGNLLVCQVPWRLWTLRRNARAEPRPASGGETEGVLPAEEFAARNPWVLDPMLEKPTLTDAVFLAVERPRARLACEGDAKAWQHMFANLDALQRAARGVPLLFLLIPDEFQVEDWLWAQVGAGLDRDLPQRRVRAWLDERGLPYVDLLPTLRAVLPLADGRRHVFHRSDTHFNTRGNRIAGEALAAGVARLANWPR